MDKEIEKRRQAINQLDSQLLKLLSERAARIVEVGRLKKEKGLTFYDPARERRILERLKKENPGPLSPEAVGAIFMEITSSCRFLEYPIRIAYLGPEATFTHQAALKTFGSQALFLPQKSTTSVFSAVEKSAADYGVVPIENSTEGVVSHTLDMFMDSDLKVVNEVLLPVRHHLLGFGSLKEVREVYSHPSALGQCQRWLEENLDKVTLRETESTAEAARLVSNRKGAAALASEIAATLYGLPILVRDVQDLSRNYTRFLVIGRHFSGRTGRDRTSILFSIKDRVGALHDMLIPFQAHGLNLTKIESRPTKRRAWEYVFFVDFFGYKDDPEVREALSELEKLCLFLRVLGSYPVADEP